MSGSPITHRLYNLTLEGSTTSSTNGSDPHCNISMSVKQRYQKRYRHPEIGQEIILEDFIASPDHYPSILFHPNAVLTSPTFLFRVFMALNLGFDHSLCAFLHDNITQQGLHLSNGGVKGFHLSAQIEVIHVELVEVIDVPDDEDDYDGDDEAAEEEEEEEEIQRMMMKEAANMVVDKLSSLRKRKREEMEGEICAVCLDELKERERQGSRDAVIGMPCDHFFHESCISKWLEKKFSCPMCRRGIDLREFGVSSSSWILSALNL